MELNKKVSFLQFGKHYIKAPNPVLIHSFDSTLNLCSKCLKMFKTTKSLDLHIEECSIPFTSIFEEPEFKFSKIEDTKTKQMMCLLSQMFIKTKTIFYEVDMYDFYVLYDIEIIGYFSRLKNSTYSLNCFLVLPFFQQQGWGTILLDFAHIFDTTSKKNPENNIIFAPKSAEKPYSKKAIFCFRNFWKYKVVGCRTINEISKKSNLTVDDAVLGLELCGFDLKKWKQTAEVEVKKPRLLSNKVYRLKK